MNNVLKQWRDKQLAESKQQSTKIHLPLNRQNPSISRRLGLRKDV